MVWGRMRRWCFLVGLIGWCCLSGGCASLKVRSVPEGAEVFLVAGNGSQQTLLGKTPYESPVSDLVDKTGGGPVVIKVKMVGYQNQNFFIPTLGGEYVVEVLLELNPYASYQDLNRVVKLALLAERQILQKQYDDALKTADTLVAINENIATVHQIRGIVNYLQNKLPESRLALLRVLELDSENPEVRTLIRTIEDKLGLQPGEAAPQ